MGKVDDMRKQRELLFAQRERAIRAREAAEDQPSAAAVKESSSRAAVREEPAPAEADADADEAPTEVRTKLGKKLKPGAKVAKPSKIAPRARGEAATPATPATPDDKSDEPKPAADKPAGKRAGKSAGKSADEVGTCSVCRKPKPLHNGLVSSHQKGLGKACAGSRKPPV